MAMYVGPSDALIGKDRLWSRWGSLKTERSSWDSHWKDLSGLFLPRNSRFTSSDRNRGDKRTNQIYDNQTTRAAKVLAAGMMAGMTSPARPWFRLSTNDPEQLKYEPVKVWLSEVTRLMLAIFSGSNTYRGLHQTYMELGVFGTHANVVMPDFDDVIRFTSLTCGEYAVAANQRGEIDTLFREFQRPVHAVVKEFGIDNVSQTVKNLWENKTLDAWVTIVHAIEPRADRDTSKADAKNMPYKSCYFELEGDKEKYLRESGFKTFPGLVPRWEVTGGDIYGSSPGMEALGDAKQLQHAQLRKAQVIDYQTKPPLQSPTSARAAEINTLPGGVTYVDSANPQGGIKTLFEVNLNLQHLLEDISDVRERIRSAFYVDLFMMLATSDQTGRMTATEVAERHEEKMLMLGPVLERLQNELLSPLIDMTFNRMVEANILPPPPPELHGANINVEFVSVLAQAQKAVSTNAVDRFVGSMASVASVRPEVLDNFNPDAWFDVTIDALGVDPKLQVPDNEVASLRKARAQAQAEAAQAAKEADQARQLGDLGKVATQGGGSNAANDVMNMFTGYGSPSAESL